MNETSDPTLDPLGHLAADWITEGLQRTGSARVLPWPTVLETVRRADERSRDPMAELASETGAETIVTGSFYEVGGEIQFATTVTDARAGTVVTSLSPISAPRDEVHGAIRTLRDRLMGGLALASSDRLAGVAGLSGDPPTFEAYRAFDRGMRS
jgi:hypothetical protein